MKVKYNAPVSLTFSLICAAILAVDQFILPGLIEALFTAEGKMTFQMHSIPSIVRVLTHIFGHGDWVHLMNNLMLILLLGPILEEKHGSSPLIWMMFITALVNGLVNGLFFSKDLLGSSGIAFMMILLVSFVNIKTGEIPITFLLVFLLYLVQEGRDMFNEGRLMLADDNISRISHIIGGICGSIFGFTRMVIKNKKVGGSPAAPATGGGNQTVIG